MENKTKAFARLLTIMDELREQCPWDKKQTMDSLRYLTIEELYELSDAILEKDMVEIKKELGDLLLHIVFYARIASETNDFDIADVINSVCDKLVHRHPHIYGDVKVANEEEVKANWEKLKLKEGNKSLYIIKHLKFSFLGIIRNTLKIKAAKTNAIAFIDGCKNMNTLLI